MAQAPAYAFSEFSELFASQEQSDLIVRLNASDEHEVPQPPSKKQREGKKKAPAPSPPPGCMDLPGHTMVLAGCSPVFKAQLTRWQEQQPSASASSTHPVITLHVDSPKQLEAARTVVEFMYKQQLPDGASQQLLVSMLQLADKYDVQSCATACCTALNQQQLEWDTAVLVLQLLAAHGESQLTSALFSKAGDALQLLLGDLEVAWASDEGRERFLALPLKGVELLLGDERTRVACENTVLVAVTIWVQQHSDSLAAEGKRRLAELIRLPYITPLFASGVLVFLPWLVEALGMATVVASMGAGCAAEYSRRRDAKVQLPSAASGFPWPASWGLGPRPLSQRKALFIEWRVPLVDLEQVFKGQSIASSNSAGFGGYEWTVQLSYSQSAQSSSEQLAAGGHVKGTLGLYAVPVIPEALQLHSSAEVPVALVQGSLVCAPPVVRGASAAAAAAHHCKGIAFGTSITFAATYRRCGWPDFWDTGGVAQWEAQHFEKWVDSNGQLTLQLNVSKFL